ncbi:MAG TPA: hypothetical protein VF885_02910 [Arthrobacter sp.]
MSVETSLPPETPSKPAEDSQAGSGLRQRTRSRRRRFRVPAAPVMVAAGVGFMLLLTGGITGIVLSIHHGQVGTVTALEALAQARTSTPPEGPAQPRSSAITTVRPITAEQTKAFREDPAFSSPEWEAQLNASREVRRSVHEADQAFAGQAAKDVWWPGLPERVRAAAGLLAPFNPAAGDAAEVTLATVAALKVCEASEGDAFISNRPPRNPADGAPSAYEEAAAAAFPGLVKAARAHICPPGSQVSTPLPVDKDQMPK